MFVDDLPMWGFVGHVDVSRLCVAPPWPRHKLTFANRCGSTGGVPADAGLGQVEGAPVPACAVPLRIQQGPDREREAQSARRR
eukprot:scaffold770_cov255-Pinguiococcus_pyrenoidosus.AAC.20